MKALVKAFKALSDETRLRIFKLILDNPDICVCDIIGNLKMTQTRISRNLATLKNAGLVDARRDGIWMHYTAIKNISCCPDIITAVNKAVKAVKINLNCK
jgi:ArsR family transcriptional regulator, arsenate/arsenite/antimonite-responsive transcriptional repressor